MSDEQEAVAETAVTPNRQDDSQAAASSEPQAANQRQTGKRKRKKGAAKGKHKQETLPPLLKQFAACGRCSFFWVGYKLIDPTFDEATAEPKHGWLTLVWNQAVRDLVYKSYGSRFDLDFYHYESCCSACQRPFIYQCENGDDAPAHLRIRL